MSDLLVAVDTGGTFTDLVAIADGRFFVAKVPSTPADPSEAVMDGIAQLCTTIGTDPSAITLLLHGTTVATNALLQRRAAKTALLTTRGFRDVLEIGRQARPRLFDLDATRPPPLIPRPLRLELEERLDAGGHPLVPLDMASLAAAIAEIAAHEIEAVAVCLLHAYANPDHERRVREAIADALPAVHVSLSSEVLPEYREYERTSTTAINAFVAPVMDRYLTAMQARLEAHGVAAPVRVMQSNGGLMPMARARRLPVSTLLSGVAAGALGGVRLAHHAGHSPALTFDMGGTSTDLSLGADGKVATNRTYEVGGLPVRLPALDVQTIGAGGGSIAYLDGSGVLKVGPRSAGAVPGPACYGRGGEEPTVTDANLVLGRLSETGLIGGRLALSRSAAAAAIRRVADPLGLSVEAAAAGIIRVVNAGMARQMRVLTVERGVDPRDCALVAFGGGGPAHAVELARDLGIRTVVIPPSPGVTSALGLALADMKTDLVQTLLLDVPTDAAARIPCAATLADAFQALEERVLEEAPTGSASAPLTLTREVEVRYRRQGHELTVGLPPGPIDAAALDALCEALHTSHARRFGYAFRDEPLIIVNLIVTATVARAMIPTIPAATPTPTATEIRRPVAFDGAWHDTPIVRREALVPGQARAGPLTVEQLDTTLVVPPGATLAADHHSNLIVSLGDGAAATPSRPSEENPA